MKLVKECQARKVQNSDKCEVLEYPLGDEEIDMATYAQDIICTLKKMHVNILSAQKQIEKKICDIASDETPVEGSTLQ